MTAHRCGSYTRAPEFEMISARQRGAARRPAGADMGGENEICSDVSPRFEQP
jgi:hypothetical protein